MNVSINPIMEDENTLVLEIRITMTPMWFLSLANQVYKQVFNRPMDLDQKKLDGPG